MATAGWTLSDQTLFSLDFGDEFKLASTSVTTPGDAPGTALASPTQSHKRNASVAGFDSSPASLESPDHNGDEHTRDGRRRPVKRACNECRQQKVSFAISSRLVNGGRIHCAPRHRGKRCLSRRPSLDRCFESLTSRISNIVFFFSLALVLSQAPLFTDNDALVAVRCRPRTFPDVHAVQAPRSRLQDRGQFQAGRQEIATCGDGARDR